MRVFVIYGIYVEIFLWLLNVTGSIGGGSTQGRLKEKDSQRLELALLYSYCFQYKAFTAPAS